jgi:L-alanine-DL-glutamate epimerase-like enolase superfamily enzyme
MTEMTIKALKVTKLRLPWADDPWLAGHALGPMRNLLVLDVETAGGIAGMGYLHLLGPGIDTVAACITEMIAPRVVGRDASEIEGIWFDCWRATVTAGRGGIAMMAISALDIALWDAMGKRCGLPLHRLWGSSRTEVRAYGSGCFRGALGDGMIAKARHYVAQGYTAIKMQVAHIGDLATDLDNVRRMRDAVGPGVEIMVDVNMGWTADIAILMGRKFEEYGVYWLEEPVLPDDYAGYRRIARALDLRIVGGETHFGRHDLKPFLDDPCLPILQPDPMRGGLTELRKIATLADAAGIRIAPHLFPELNIHLLCSIPNASWLEQMGLLDDLWVEPLVIANGTARAPERPGHGLAFRGEVLKDFMVK